MRVLLFLGVLGVVGLVVTGAIKLQKTDKSVTIQIDRAKVREEAGMVVDKGKEVLREAGSALDQARKPDNDGQ